MATWNRSRATARSASTSMPPATLMVVTERERLAGSCAKKSSAPPSRQPSTAACTARASCSCRSQTASSPSPKIRPSAASIPSSRFCGGVPQNLRYERSCLRRTQSQ